MTRQAVFVRLASRPIPRVSRMMSAVEGLGYRTEYWGAFRDFDLPSVERWDGVEVRRFGPQLPLLNGRRFHRYIFGMAAFNLLVLSRLLRVRPDFVHVSDIESAPAALLYARVLQKPILYNIHDNFADRYASVSSSARWILNGVEGLVVRLSRSSVVPEEFRRARMPRYVRKYVSVVRNSPTDVGPMAPPPWEGRLRVLYAGWLDWGRGLQFLLEAADAYSWLSLWVAGEGSSEVLEEVRRRPNIRYLGFVNHSQVMAATSECHVVSAMYDPVRPINRLAAPNKLAEALCVGRPVLMNSEVVVGHQPELAQSLVVATYHGTAVKEALASLMERVRDEPDAYSEMCRSARKAYTQLYSAEATRAAAVEAISGAFAICGRRPQ